MRAVLKTTDPVILTYAADLLSQEGIESVVFDTHASVMDGSHGFPATPAVGAGRGFRPRRHAAACRRTGCFRRGDVTRFLDGKVIAAHPEGGFRSGTDAVMLASAVPPRPARRCWNWAVGAGAAGLCLLARRGGHRADRRGDRRRKRPLRTRQCRRQQIRPARLSRPTSSICRRTAARLRPCFCNPPFHEGGQSSPDPVRARALADEGSLGQWLNTGLQRTVSGGFLTAIIRADRLPEALGGHCGQRGLCCRCGRAPAWRRSGWSWWPARAPARPSRCCRDW